MNYNTPSSRRGAKRKHQGMDEETLRKRACKLAKHKYLATLYKTLVGKKVLTAAEFWEEYGKDIDVRQSNMGLVTGMSNTVMNKTMERDNMWSLYQLFQDEILAHQEKQNEEENNANNSGGGGGGGSGSGGGGTSSESANNKKSKMTINLKVEHILEIFLHLPEVKLAYEQNVPHRFTEKDFWTMFLQSHYFKRKRKKDVTSSISEKETEMDKLLKKYTKQLKEQQDRTQKEGGSSNRKATKAYGGNGDDGGGGDRNSFGAQIERIQRAKNEEVDVKGKLERMREEVAAARAAKQNGGEIGDMNSLVNQIENGDININQTATSNGNMNGNHNINGNSRVNTKDGDGDVEMKGDDALKSKLNSKSNANDDGMDARIEANKPLKRRNFKKKLKMMDPAVDLAATMQSFTEVIEDPGNEASKNISRGEVQNWFSQVNKHGTMLLYQSLNQRNGNRNRNGRNEVIRQKEIEEAMTHVPKVSYGRSHGRMEVDGDGEDEKDVEMKDNAETPEKADNLKVMEMEYEDRLNVETAFEDLQEDDAKQYIELNIKDQSVYWGDNLLMNDRDLNQMKQVAKRLSDYLGQVEKAKPKLANLGAAKISNVVSKNDVCNTIQNNTVNNAAHNRAEAASQRIVENRRNKSGAKGTKEQLMIYAQDKELKAHPKIIQQLPEFQRPMTELVRHYWGCFPANHARLKKAKIIVDNLENYRRTLEKNQATMQKKGQANQKILLQELVDLVDRVLKHFNSIQSDLEKKQQNRKQQLSEAK